MIHETALVQLSYNKEALLKSYSNAAFRILLSLRGSEVHLFVIANLMISTYAVPKPTLDRGLGYEVEDQVTTIAGYELSQRCVHEEH